MAQEDVIRTVNARIHLNQHHVLQTKLFKLSHNSEWFHFFVVRHNIGIWRMNNIKHSSFPPRFGMYETSIKKHFPAEQCYVELRTNYRREPEKAFNIFHHKFVCISLPPPPRTATYQKDISSGQQNNFLLFYFGLPLALVRCCRKFLTSTWKAPRFTKKIW